MTLYFDGRVSSAVTPTWHHVHDGAQDLPNNGSGSGKIVSSPVRPGYSYTIGMQTTGVQAGSGNVGRVEIGTTPGGSEAHSSEGQEAYYGFSIYLPSTNRGLWAPSSFDWNNLWQLITNTTFQGEMHLGIETGGNGVINPHLYFNLDVKSDGTGVAARAGGRWDDAGVMAYDAWIDFVVHVVWSTGTGLVELWKNGSKVWSLAARTMLDSVNLAYLEIQNYHNFVSSTLNVYFSAVTIGDSFAAVNPTPPTGGLVMSRLKNAKVTVVQLTVPATIHDDVKGRVQKYPIGHYVLTDIATGKVSVLSPVEYAASYETVSGTVRPKSDAYTAVVATAQATVTSQVAGKHQRAQPGDFIVTNNATGDVQIYRPGEYAAAFE